MENLLNPKTRAIAEVAHRFSLEPAELREGRRLKNHAAARHVLAYVLTSMGLSWPEAATAIGIRSHATIGYGVYKVHKSVELLGIAKQVLKSVRK